MGYLTQTCCLAVMAFTLALWKAMTVAVTAAVKKRKDKKLQGEWKDAEMTKKLLTTEIFGAI